LTASSQKYLTLLHAFLSLAKLCSGHPEPPEDGTVVAVNTGNRYGPICSNHLPVSDSCPVVKVFHTDSLAGSTGTPGIEFRIEAESGYAINEIHFMVNFSLPVLPAALSFNPDFLILTDIQNLMSANMVIMGAKGINIQGGQTQRVMMEVDYDQAAHTNVCVENVECIFCNGGDCVDAKENFYKTWKEVTFQLYNCNY
jgi:hypothetical protein